MKIKWTEEKIQQLQAEGRGKGAGANYKPWIQVQDFSSLGNSRRVFSRKTGRVHHLFSDVEWHLFLLLEFSREVVDIREQFPLDREATQSIAAQHGIKHPMYPGTRVPFVMTTDFFVVINRSGKDTLEAFSCKRTDGAEDPRTLEKLEIERSYFAGIGPGIPHHLVFHSELPKNKVKNLIWCRNATLDANDVEEYPDTLVEHGERLAYEMSRLSQSLTLADYCANYDRRTGAPTGMGLRVARALLWQGILSTDLNQEDLAATPVSMFRVGQPRLLWAVGA